MLTYPRQVLLILIYYCRQWTLVLGNVKVSPCQQTPVSSTSVDEIVGLVTSISDGQTTHEQMSCDKLVT